MQYDPYAMRHYQPNRPYWRPPAPAYDYEPQDPIERNIPTVAEVAEKALAFRIARYYLMKGEAPSALLKSKWTTEVLTRLNLLAKNRKKLKPKSKWSSMSLSEMKDRIEEAGGKRYAPLPLINAYNKKRKASKIKGY